MAVQRIDSAFDLDKLNQEYSRFNTIVSQSQDDITNLYSAINQFKSGVTLTNSAESFSKLGQAMTGVSASTQSMIDQSKKLAEMQGQLDDVLKKLSDTEKKLNEQRSTGKVKTEEQIRATLEAREANKNLTQDILAQSDAYKRLEVDYQRAASRAKTLQANALQTGNPDDQAAADQASAEANSLNTQLKNIDTTVGESRRRVGSYTEALKILEEQLASVRETMNTLANAGQQNSEEYSKLSQEAELLTTLVGQQEKGFSSVTQEIRNAERALQTLRAEGFGTGEAFDKLRASTVEAAQAQKEFQRQQKLLESEAPVLGALTIAAKALGGAYAIGAGTAALFADGNEKVEKEINKLVAIMTILQGLDEAYKLLQEGGAIAIAFKTAQTKLLTTATELYSAATDGAVIATESFEASLIATGIGAIIVALSVGVGVLISKLIEMATAEETAVKRQKEFAEATKALNDTIQQEIELLGRSNEDQIRAAKDQLALASALGITKEKELAIKSKIAALEEEQAKKAYDAAAKIALAEQGAFSSVGYDANTRSRIDELNKKLKDHSLNGIDYFKEFNKITGDAQRSDDALAASREYHLSEYNKGLEKTAKLEAESRKYISRGKEVPQLLKDKIDSQNAVNELEKSTAENAEKTRTQYEDSERDHSVILNEITKLSVDERRKLIFESTKLEADLVMSKNDLILNDDRSTLAERLAALKSNSEQQLAVLRLETYNIIHDPTSSKDDKKIARKKLADEELEVQADLNDKLYKEGYAFAQRDKEARLSISKDILNDQLKTNEALLNEDKAQQQASIKDINEYIAKRKEALSSSYIQRRGLVQADQLNELSNAAENRKTPEEILAINSKYQEQLNQLERDYAKQREDEEKKETDIILKYWEQYYDKKKNQLSKEEDDEIIALNNKYQSRNMSIEKYSREREEIEFKSQKKILENQLLLDFKDQENTKEGSPEREAANKKRSEDELALSDLITNHKKKNAETLAQYEIRFGEETISLVQTAVDARYTNELNHIQKLIDANDRLKEQETARISGSTLSEVEKAAVLERIALQTQARNEALARQERKIKHDQAVADKAFSVAEAIEKGVVAVLAAAKYGPVVQAIEAALVGVEIAKIIATPIPAYKSGIGFDKNHPGGLAIVGDGYEREFIQEPGKPGYWSGNRPTLVDLPAYTKVIPESKIEQMKQDGARQMFVDQAGRLRGITFEDKSAKKIDQLIQTQALNTRAMIRAINESKSNITVVNDAAMIARIQKIVKK